MRKRGPGRPRTGRKRVVTFQMAQEVVDLLGSESMRLGLAKQVLLERILAEVLSQKALLVRISSQKR